MDTGSAPGLTDTSPGQPASGRTRNWAQGVIAAGVLFYICNEAELVLVVLLISMLLAFILAPLVELLQRSRLPRPLCSFIAVVVLLAVVFGAFYLSYNQAASFVQDLPKYSRKIKEEINRLRQKAESFESTGEEAPSARDAGSKSVLTVRSGPSWGDLLTRGFGSVSQGLVALSFVPFLVYFMLSWQHHVRSATVMLFRMENRHTAYLTLGLIAKMMRAFVVGNLLIGLFMAVVSTIIFGVLGLPFFYFVGPISGFLSLIPYLGLLLALLPPLVIGIGQLTSGDVVVIAFTVLGLHLLSLNVLYPKVLGNRLKLNPLAVTISLLFWGWMWGAMGLLLAVPITGAVKIVFDHVRPLKPYGVWLGE
jgi:predicted PurR-regulated permease PerM